MKQYQKVYIIFFILNRRSWGFKPLLEKAKTTSVDGSSDKPKETLVPNPFKIRLDLEWCIQGLGSSISYQCHGLLRKPSKITTLAPE